MSSVESEIGKILTQFRINSVQSILSMAFGYFAMRMMRQMISVAIQMNNRYSTEARITIVKPTIIAIDLKNSFEMIKLFNYPPVSHNQK